MARRSNDLRGRFLSCPRCEFHGWDAGVAAWGAVVTAGVGRSEAIARIGRVLRRTFVASRPALVRVTRKVPRRNAAWDDLDDEIFEFEHENAMLRAKFDVNEVGGRRKALAKLIRAKGRGVAGEDDRSRTSRGRRRNELTGAQW